MAPFFSSQDVPGQLHLGQVILDNGLDEPVVTNTYVILSQDG
jgi:hypothetical protein